MSLLRKQGITHKLADQADILLVIVKGQISHAIDLAFSINMIEFDF